MSRNRVLARAWAAAALALLCSRGAAAYDFRLVPSIGVRGEYNSNLFMTETSPVETSVLTVSPGMEGLLTTEKVEAGFGGTVYVLRYDGEDELDDTDYAARGRFSYAATPELRLSATGEFRRESRPDRYFEESGLVDRSWNYRHIYTASAEWTATEKALVTASYRFERLDYPSERDEADADIHTGGLGLVYRLASFVKDTRARANLVFSRGAYENVTSESYSLTVGFFRAIHELWSLTANVGGMFTRSDFDYYSGENDSDSTGLTGDISLVYAGERGRASFVVSHGLSPAFGYNGASLRTMAVVAAERQFLHDVSATIAGGVYRNSSDAGEFTVGEIDERSYYVQPGLRWRATTNITFDLAYRRRWLDNRVTGERADQDVVYAGVNLAYPLFDE